MYYFLNDYSEGCLPEVMEALVKTNMESTPGYGLDPYCEKAANRIKERFACPDAAVHFLVGGTQTNFTSISAFLRPWEAVIAADTAHIYVHETGAVEARGHKVYALPAPDGKLTPEIIRKAVRDHQLGVDEHMVMPRMVYLSQATELGTVYTKAELAAVYETCRELSLYLYMDGARLGTGDGGAAGVGKKVQHRRWRRRCRQKGSARLWVCRQRVSWPLPSPSLRPARGKYRYA